MQKIGATLAEATDAIASISPSGNNTYSSHPNKERRIKAITKGKTILKKNSFAKKNVNLCNINQFNYEKTTLTLLFFNLH